MRPLPARNAHGGARLRALDRLVERIAEFENVPTMR